MCIRYDFHVTLFRAKKKIKIGIGKTFLSRIILKIFDRKSIKIISNFVSCGFNNFCKNIFKKFCEFLLWTIKLFTLVNNYVIYSYNNIGHWTEQPIKTFFRKLDHFSLYAIFTEFFNGLSYQKVCVNILPKTFYMFHLSKKNFRWVFNFRSGRSLKRATPLFIIITG